MSSTEGLDFLPGNPGVYARVTVNYSPIPEINIKGGTVSIANGDSTPTLGALTDYGDVTLGTTTDHTFTIENQGTLPLSLTGTPIVSISGSSAFTVQTQPVSNTIAASDSQTFEVRFNPTCTQTGLQTAVVSIASDDADEDPYTFTVQGKSIDNVSPLAVAKNITVQLDTNGSVTVNAEDLNNNSTDNCGISNYKIAAGSSGTVCNVVGEEDNLELTAPAGTIFDSILYASYGNSTGSCGNFVPGYCDASNSMSIVSGYLLGQNSGTIYASNNTFGDPCDGTSKNLSVEASYKPATGSETFSITYSCSDIGTHDVVLYVTDNSGNVSLVNATITVEDKTAPIVAVKNITVQLDATGNATIVASDIDDSSTDNCGIDTLELDKTAFTCANIGPNTVQLKVTDNNGNSDIKDAIVTVEDKIAPVVATKNITVQLDATGAATIVAADVDNGSTDACGIATLVVSPNTFTCVNVGTNTVTLTATDANGNISSQIATVTVENKNLPVVLTKNITVQLNAAGNATIVASDVNNGSTVSCGAPSLVVSTNTFTCVNVGANTVTLTVTVANGILLHKRQL
jgi:hypothetical protein